MPELSGKTALITGAGAGIGRASAKLLSGAGAAIAVVDRDESAVRNAVDEVVAGGGQAVGYTVDLVETATVRGLVERVVADLGRLDVLINNAGVTGAGHLLELEEEVWDRAFLVNLKAPFLLTQAFGRHAQARGGGGKIVNLLTSSLFRATFISGPDYVSSKGGLLGLTRASAAYFAPLDINVNAVVPGLTDTGRQRLPGETDEQHQAKMQAWISEGPLANGFKRVSTAEDVAEAILFLSLPSSRQITGQVIHTSAGAVV